MSSPFGTLDKLPYEVILQTLENLDVRDLIQVCRLNSVLRQTSLPIIERHINVQMREGYQLYMNITVERPNLYEGVGFPRDLCIQEIALLTTATRVNEDNLDINFELVPIDLKSSIDSGFANPSEISYQRTIRLVEPELGFNVTILLYFAKAAVNDSSPTSSKLTMLIGPDTRLENVKLMNVELLDTDVVMQRVAQDLGNPHEDTVLVADSNIKIGYQAKRTDGVVTVEFNTLLVPVDWWVCQINNPYSEIFMTEPMIT